MLVCLRPGQANALRVSVTVEKEEKQKQGKIRARDTAWRPRACTPERD
jgi:hypothetical protein